MTIDRARLDSTGDLYTTWGLPYPRGRGETSLAAYDDATWVFGASGGASLYRADVFRTIGLFDESFFAYYEDTDLSFRAQWAGFRVAFVPASEAYHAIGVTSGRIKGFTTYQTLKNLPLVVAKDVPLRLLPVVWPRFTLAYWSFFGRALARGHGWPACKGVLMAALLVPGKFLERRAVRQYRRTDAAYIKSLLTWDLPPNATKLRSVRARWWRLTGRQGRARAVEPKS